MRKKKKEQEDQNHSTKRTEEQEEKEQMTEQKAKKGRSYFLQAPVVVVVSISRSEDEVTDNEDYATGAMAAQNMMLAAWSKGIASKLRTGEYSFSTEIKDHFGIPSENRIVGFLFLGYPADRAVPPARQRDDGNVIWVS